jgi:hypothetical protein
MIEGRNRSARKKQNAAEKGSSGSSSKEKIHIILWG